MVVLTRSGWMRFKARDTGVVIAVKRYPAQSSSVVVTTTTTTTGRRFGDTGRWYYEVGRDFYNRYADRAVEFPRGMRGRRRSVEFTWTCEEALADGRERTFYPH